MESLGKRIDSSPILTQLVPLVLTIVVFSGFITVLHSVLFVLNLFPTREPILLSIRWYDVIVGATIYLKTSIDFAIFMGRMMAANPGWRSRIAIEIGTAAGNALGTIAVITLWVFLKDIHLLLALMVFLASLVLFELAHASLEHFEAWQSGTRLQKLGFFGMHGILDPIKKLIDPILLRIMPDLSAKMKGKEGLSWSGLLGFAMTVPFILGLDDFAGYVPLFNVVNVYGFAIGVIGAHTILNIALFLSPSKTIAAVKNEVVSFAGAVAFIGLGAYGLIETTRILLSAI